MTKVAKGKTPKAKLPKGKAPTAASSTPSEADAYSTWAFVLTALGWGGLLLGQRALTAFGGPAKLFTGLGVLALLVAFGQRLWAFRESTGSRRRVATMFVGLSGLGLGAAALMFATSDALRGQAGFGKPAVGEADAFGDFGTAIWVSLCLASLVPSFLGELARRSMLKAPKMEWRRVASAVSGGLALACALVYVSLFTYAATKADVHVDYSYYRVAKPSDSTRRMLASIEDKLILRAYFSGTSEVGEKVVRYLRDVARDAPRVTVETVDHELSPELAKEDKVARGGVVMLVRGNMKRKLDIGTDPGRAAPKLRKLDGEFQKVLLKAMRDQRTAYFTTGHGEFSNKETRKSGRRTRLLKKLVESQNYTVKSLGLAEGLGSKIPEDAAMVVVLGPSQAFSEREVESLKAYADGGGKLLLALDPESKEDFAPLAAIAGIKWSSQMVVNDKMVYRLDHQDSDKRVMVVKRFSSHPVVSTLSKLSARGAAVLLVGAAPLEKLDDADKSFRIDFSVRAPAQSYIDLNGNWTFDKDSEKQRTFNLAAAVTRGSGSEMRAFVIGDANAFSDKIIEFAQTNRLLFLEVVRWLGGDESFSGEISSTEDVRIVHTKGEDQVWFYGTIGAFPSLILGSGLYYARRRRRRLSPKRGPNRKRTKRKSSQASSKDEPSSKDTSGKASS